MSLYQSLLEKMDGREYSHYFFAVCPFHDDSKPSLMVDERGYFCKACGARGNLKKLDMRVRRGFRIRNTVSSILPRWKSWEREYGDLEGIAEYAHDNLLRHKSYRKYYEQRKCEEFIEKGFLGYIGGWCTIPVIDKSSQGIIDLVVRASSGKGNTRYVVAPTSSDCPRPLYCPNWERVTASDLVYVVYGIFDAISLELCGLPCVTGITGKNIAEESLNALHKKFVIIPDWKEEKDAHQLANALGWRASVKSMLFPEDCKDPDDIRRIYGEDALKEMLA